MTTRIQRAITPHNPHHPLWREFPREKAAAVLASEGIAGYNATVRRINAAIRRSDENPYQYVWRLPKWKLVDCLLGYLSVEDWLADPDIPVRWKADTKLVDYLRRCAVQLVLILGGNRAGKTEYIKWRVGQDLAAHPGANIWMFHMNDKMSIEYHQRGLWLYLPPEWRDRNFRDGKTADDPTYLHWKYHTGFAEGRMTGPNAAGCTFKTYNQDMQSAIQGGEIGCPQRERCIGFAADELIPVEWFRTMKARLATRNARGVVAFTPWAGYSDMVAEFVDGAEAVYSEEANEMESARYRHMPMVQRCADASMAVVYFHGKYNLFSPYRNLVKLYGKDSDERKAMVLYGLATKKANGKFPKYDQDLHRVPRERIYEEGEQPWLVHDFKFAGTNYLICDPANGKNWVMIWIRVDMLGRWWVYREFPCKHVPILDLGFPEAWAEAGVDTETRQKHDGRTGGGARPLGLGIRDYKLNVARMEQWDDLRAVESDELDILAADALNGAREPMALRIMDSKFGHTPTQTRAANTTLLDECAMAKLYFDPAPGQGKESIDEGVEMVRDQMGPEQGWDPDGDPLGTQARGPGLFVSEDCENTDFALRIWTGLDGNKGATKDFIDLLRYAALAKICYIPESPTQHRARSYNLRRRFDSVPGENGEAKTKAALFERNQQKRRRR